MKKLHSFIATLLAITIILTMFSGISVVSAKTAEAEAWNGVAATEFAGGTGTQADPFLIENGAQLAKAVIDKGLNNGAAAYYMITNDIYLNEDYANYKNWGTNAPENNWGITYSSSAFTGYLDGGYHTIYGMYYSKGGSYAGLVAYLSGTGATICNLTIANSYVNNTSGNSTALFAGRIDTGTITNCIARDSYLTNKDNKTMAGIAAWSNNNATKITNCGAYGLTFSSSNTVGGILAQSNNGNAKVYSCYSGGTYIFGNTGNIDANNSWTVRSYTDVNGADKAGVVEILDGSMKGENALTAMPKLDPTVWKATDGYPTLIGNGVKGETWSGAKAAWFAGGNGTAEHPFLIETGEQLYKAISDKGMYAGTGAHYLITADITLNADYANYADWATTAPKNNWAGVYSTGSFAGYLDGGYHTIYGLYFSKTSECSRAGLIPYLSGDNATLSNLYVTNSYVYSNADSTAVLVGRLDNGTISQCIAHDSMVSNGSKTVQGGIVAYANHASAKILNCGIYDITFDGTSVVGGILGKSATNNATVRYCYSAGTFIFGDTNKIFIGNFDAGDGSRCYTNVDGTDKNGVLERLDSSTHPMTGATAISVGMPRLAEPGVWKATEDSYPVFALYNGDEGETWTGAKATSYNGGSGTKEDPYIIVTAEQLYKAISDLGKDSSGNALYYLVVADIYVNDNYENYADWATTAPANNWLPTSGKFIGHLDGGRNTIYGLYSVRGAWRNGLIPYIDSGATVKNVIITKAYIHDNTNTVGAIAGAMYANTKIENCLVYDAVVSSAGTDNGGIVGAAAENTTTINNCGTYNLTISGTECVGGILGRPWKAISGANGTRVYNCYSIGNYPLGFTDKSWCNYVYTDVSGAKASITTVAANTITGSAAAATMKYFDFINTWETVENGYPVFKALKSSNLNQEIAASYSVTRENNSWVIFTSKVDMPKISPVFDDNIFITVDGVEKKVQEVGVVINRKGLETSDISTVSNTPLTGYKIVGYTNGADNASVVTVGGQIEINAIVNGTVDYTANSYIMFEDGSSVLGDLYDAEPSTESITIDSGYEVSDIFKGGDANFDGVINLKDVVRFKKYAVDSELNKEALFDVIDLDGDEAFNATDISQLSTEVIEILFNTPVSEMELVFEDNFDTLNLDTTNKWDFTNYMQGYGVETVETSDVQQIVSENGDNFLRLTSYKTEDGTYKATKSISTGNKLTFVHGYLEVRAKVPTVQGAWPSLWLKSNTGNANLGYDSSLVYNTEVDVFEVMGGNKAISEMHKWQKDPLKDIRYGAYKNRSSYAITDNDWHTYGMLWTEDEIVISVDGVTIQTYDLNKDYEVKWPWDTGLGMENFKTQPMCITLNNFLFTPEYTSSTDGSWAADYVVGDDFTESVYDIDYVRLYQDSTDTTAKLYKAN